MELSTQNLVRRLCSNLANEAVSDPQHADKLSAKLFDTAFSNLLGLNLDVDTEYIAPDARTSATIAGLEHACQELASSSYSDLAGRLGLLAALLPRSQTTAVLGTEQEQLSGIPATLPLTEQHAVLAFLLRLQGNRLSVRRRQVTYQTTHESATPNMVAPLGSAVFCEPPDPFALTEVSTTAVLLPSECRGPNDPFAGAADVQDLSSCMSSRPAWSPTAPTYAPHPPSAAWLPMPPPLVEMQSDRRRGAVPPPLGLPWGLLSMGEVPGASTAFQALASNSSDDTSDESGSPLPGLNGSPGAAASPASPVAGATASPQGVLEVKQLGSSSGLWTLEEAGLARDALLALQGVHSALMRLQGMLAVPHALPRLSIAGMLSRLAAAAELRQQLERFVAAHLAPPGAAADPVLRAFAAALEEVLRQQVAGLQALERDQSSSWVRRVEVGGKQGREFHRRGLTLLQVVLHTGRLQSQLRSLAALCWCLSHQHGGQQLGGEVGSPGDNGSGGPGPAARWEGFPRGAPLLSYLHQALLEADDSQLPTQRFLFTQALQPYLAHLRSWAYTAAPLLPAFATRGEEAVAPCLEFMPPQEDQLGRPRLAAVPCDPPSFLQPMHAAFMRAGAQLRLLHSLPQQRGREIAAQLSSIAEEEQQCLSQGAAGTQASLVPPSLAAAAFLPGSLQQLDGAEPGDDSWLCLPAGSATQAEAGCALLKSSSQLQQAAISVGEADRARLDAVEAWLQDLAVQRQQAQQAAAAEALDRTATVKERHQRAAARQAELAARRRSSKTLLHQQQSAELALSRAKAASERVQELAEDRDRLAQAALKEHAVAVAELTAAVADFALRQPEAPSAAGAAAGQQLGGGSFAAGGAGAESLVHTSAEQQAVISSDVPPANVSSAVAQSQLGPGPPDALLAATAEPTAMASMAPVGPYMSAFAAERPAPGLSQVTSALVGVAADPPQAGAAVLQGRGNEQRQRWQHPSGASDEQASGAADEQAEGCAPPLEPPQQPQELQGMPPWEQQREQGREEQGQAVLVQQPGPDEAAGQRPAPLAAALEICLVQSVLSQYRAVSQACVRLFLDELRLLEHLESLRRLFFMGAGDWADAFVAALGTQADSLQALSQHGLERLLHEAMQGTCLEADPYAARLRVRLLPGLSTVSAQVQAVSLPTPQRRSRAAQRAPVSVVLPPTVLDGLDCVSLDYTMGWPLAAVITQDIMQGYAAVFSMLVRLKRVELLLRGLQAPLLLHPKSTADVLLSEEDEDRAHRRLQRLRAFRHGASQLLAALQAFLHSCTSGPEWMQLLAKLMVSSEQVAATVLGRGPSATLTGVLSRMSSLAGPGSAAHRLVLKARSMSRQSSRQPSRQGSLDLATLSLPGTPRALAAAGVAAAGAAVPPVVMVDAEPRLSRFGRFSSGAAPAGEPAAAAPLSHQQPHHPVEPCGGSDSSAGQAQEGIADLQELLDLHRAYVRAVSAACLTFGGNPAVREAVDAALQAAIDFALRLQAAVRLGSAGRGQVAWAQVLRRDSAWAPLEEGMALFHARVEALHGLLEEAGRQGVLAELALQLDYSGFYSRQRQQQQQRRPHQQ